MYGSKVSQIFADIEGGSQGNAAANVLLRLTSMKKILLKRRKENRS